MLLAGAASAQQPYTWMISGSVSNCYPGQTIDMTVADLSNANTLVTTSVAVDPNTCTYFTLFHLNAQYVGVTASTQCNGAVVSMWDSTYFSQTPDSVLDVIDFNCGGGGAYDCMQVLNGPDMPGTPCDDGNPATLNDLWSNQCVCAGQDTSGMYDCLGVLNGSNLPGTWCTNFMGDTGVWSANCVCLADTMNGTWDCLQIWNGPNMPGTPCTAMIGGQVYSGFWSANCTCTPDTNIFLYDCLGILNGPNMPGTVCDDNDPMTAYSFWSTDCVCTSDSIGYYDCLQIPNGPNVPGAPCMAFGVVGTWSDQCVCEPNNTDPCQANFWVLQAWGNDSLPIPYELWIWNLTSGGSGVYTYLWSFGDGTSSTDAYPTHTYSGNGPYDICLTIADNNGCTSTHCDSISIDQNGIYNGMAGNNGDRQDGFTINVLNPSANGIEENGVKATVSLWPNPATDVVNVAVNGAISGARTVTITDLNGRVVLSERHTFNGGRTQFTMNTAQLADGIYTVRIGNDNMSQRFVRTH